MRFQLQPPVPRRAGIHIAHASGSRGPGHGGYGYAYGAVAPPPPNPPGAVGPGAHPSNAPGTPGAPGAPSDYTSSIEEWLPVVGQVASGALSQDPRVQVQIWRAKIKNFREMRSRVPLMAWYYDNEINKLQARIKATEELIRLQRESEEGWRNWRNLGQAALVVGVGAVSVLLFAGAARLLRPAPTERV